MWALWKLAWCVLVLALSGQCLAEEPESDEPKTPAEAITKDLNELSEQVDEVAEDQTDEEKEDESNKHKLDTTHAEEQSKFERLYQHALDEALVEGKREFQEYERSSVEDLDLVNVASDHLKRYWYAGQCRRDYTKSCPNNWSFDQESKLCTAPVDYHGPCERTKDFSHMQQPARSEYAWRCHVSWPCLNEPPMDESAVCPLEWTKLSGTVCIAPASYDGICPPIASFDGYNLLDKAKYEQMCGVKWPRVVPSSTRIGPTLEIGEGYASMGGSEWMNGAIDESGAMVPV
ncbi:cpw-wpc domain-containing, putative [Babesia ovis]|uniref:Cpw-wpc domain-containing, putative n=1 Tax=Babesia ovis TaxID=5869 RepID=A0A9W5T8U9_BABOV|nr:cpw-wpc domain-containing, putative [Babesia ovis]